MCPGSIGCAARLALPRLTLSPRRVLFLGDSITEGVNDEKCSGNVIDSNDAPDSYTYSCPAVLGAEFGMVAQGGQGWTVIGHDGHTPPLPQSWKWQFDGMPHSFSPAPDYVVAMEGGIDQLVSPASPATVQSIITAWLGDARATLPNARIFLVVTFNGFYRDVVTNAFNDYVQANRWDKSVYLIDLGPAAQAGLLMYFTNQGSLYTCDGIHPLAARQAILGQMLGQAIQAALGD